MSPINIHNKEYYTVAERIALAGENLVGVETSILTHEPLVAVKVRAFIKRGEETLWFDGISAANPAKAIEKMSPYEVAETSALGRALGFAGFGSADGIASADEMIKAGVGKKAPVKFKKAPLKADEPPFEDGPVNNQFTI